MSNPFDNIYNFIEVLISIQFFSVTVILVSR